MPKEITKEDYYSTPNAQLGDNDDKHLSGAGDDDATPPADVPKETPAPKEVPPADKGDLSEDDLAKLKQINDKTPPAAPAEKPKEEPKTGDVDYEIEVDDNSPLTDDDIQEVVKMAESRGLSKEEAQAEIDRRETLLKRGMSAGEHKANKVIEGYEREVSSHPLFATREIREESMAAVNTALDKFFDKDFKDRFELFYKRDVHLLTALHRLGKPFVADTMPGSVVPGKVKQVDLEPGTDEAESARLKALYPEQFPG